MTPKKTIPTFSSIEEEATFWDTHDTTDYEDAFKPVKVRFAPSLSQGLTVRLQSHDLNDLRTVAHEKGIGVSSLVRMWIKNMLSQEKHRLA